MNEEKEEKKEYVAPKMEVVELEVSSQLLAHSGLNDGQMNACEHGSHAWFCDDYED